MFTELVLLGLYLSLALGVPLEGIEQKNLEVSLNKVDTEEANIKRIPRNDEDQQKLQQKQVTNDSQSKTASLDALNLGHLKPASGGSEPTPSVINYNIPPQTTYSVPASYPKPQVNYNCPPCESSHTESHSATVPYIAGYRLIPIVSRKQVILKDHSSCPEGITSGLISSQVSSSPEVETHLRPYPPSYPNYNTDCDYSTNYGVICNQRSWDPEALLRSFEDSGYFSQNQKTDHGLQEPSYYDNKIEDLNNHIEHVKSMRNAAQGNLHY